MSTMPHADPDCTKAHASTVDLTIEARKRDLGDGFTVRRLLPSAAHKMVGPFIFVDHMGPVHMKPGVGLDVRPHPHINLATVTFLFEGEILHRDSLGTEQVIRPGEVNWMTAGRGITHSERTPGEARRKGPRVHGMQLWVALPTSHEEVEPSFQHAPADTIPLVERAGARLRVIAGNAYGATAPVKVASPLFYVEAQLERGTSFQLPEEHPQRCGYVVSGAVVVDGKAYEEGTMVVWKDGVPAHLEAVGPTRIMLLGGAPFPEKRHIYWNFVSSSEARIEQAKAAWKAREFPLVPGDETEFIPLPSI